MNKIDFSEIQDWEQFENLVAEYFNETRDLEDNNLTEVFVEPVGKGPDGGRDILLTFRINDSILSFERRWIVQCKFYDILKKSSLDRINIPTLIEEYRADGYLLICKNSVTNGVSTTFENLRNNCRRNYKYVIWNGSTFVKKLYKTNGLHEHYFPDFFDYKMQRAKLTGINDILT
ncbi:restriction endonuclease [Flavobacterium sp. WV_118_3]|uniref:restriction endonuclease n=1 Tax=Flavobacterium sp. WV_118_3 TaxID=3151764 RepID=UPI00321B5B0F